MADDRYSWLDEEAAERLLRGEPADAAVGGDDARARADAERLVLALADALAETSGDRFLGAEVDGALPGELPGEAAAAAAFRKTMESRAGSPRPGSAGDQQAPHTSAGCPVARRSPAHRIPPPSQRPGEEATEPAVSRQACPIGQWVWPFRSGRLGQLGRPLRAGLAVAIAGCALGGVAVATGVGVLPLPFGDGNGEPTPAASATAATTGPYGSAPGTGENGHTSGPGASASGDGQETGGSGRGGGQGSSSGGLAGESAGMGNGRPGQPDSGPGKSAGEVRTVIVLCHQHEAGTLDTRGRHRLEQEAGGRQAVDPYCDRLLDKDGGGAGSGSGSDSGPGPDSGSSPGSGTDDSGSGGTSGEDGSSGGEVSSRYAEQRSAEPRSTAPAPGETPVPAPAPSAGTPAPMPAEKPAPASSGGSLDVSGVKRPVR